MLTEKEIIGKLYEAAEQFRMHMEARRYPQAKHCYETAVNVAVFVGLDEAESQKLFGIRGEKGVIIQDGKFGIERVLRMYEKNIFGNGKK